MWCGYLMVEIYGIMVITRTDMTLNALLFTSMIVVVYVSRDFVHKNIGNRDNHLMIFTVVIY